MTTVRPLLRWLLGLALVGACGPQERGPDAVQSEQPEVSSTSAAPAVTSDDRPVVLFLGTSLTAGYGLASPESSFPALIQERIDRDGARYRVVNAGVSGDTSAGGLRRLPRLLDDPIALLVLELGANDGLRGLDVDALAENLDAAITQLRSAHPGARVVVAGMESPPNLGPRYTERFRAVFPRVAESRGSALIPFLLDGVAGIPELNQADGIHPTAEGHRRIAELVWDTVAEELEIWEAERGEETS